MIKKVLKIVFLFSIAGCFMGGTRDDGIVVLSSKSGSETSSRRPFSHRSRSRLGSSSGSSRSKQTYTVGAGGTTTGFLRENPSLRVEDYLDSVVYIYYLIGKCGQSSSKTAHKTCISGDPEDESDLGCLDPDLTEQAYKDCIGACDSNNDNDCETLGYQGSGVFISNSHILTNHHLVEEAIGDYSKKEDHDDNENTPPVSKYYYHFFTGVETYSDQYSELDSVICSDEDSDLAYFSLERPLSDADPPEHGDLDDLSLLDELWTIGNPSGVKWTASKGHLTNKDPVFGSGFCPRGECITYDIPTFGGNSGGPVFDSSGLLIALHAFSISNRDTNQRAGNLNGGPHIDRIKEFLAGTDCRGSGGASRNSLTQGLSRSERQDLARRIKELVLDLN